MKNEELINFKKLLEYFVSHLEWIETNDENIKGYDKYIRPLIEDNSFKITGQGYDGAGIQNQISNWDEYESGKVCINIQGNYGSYKSVKCYLNWIDTGINILARWSGSRIVSLYQDEFIYWEKPTRRVSLNIEYSLEELNIFGDDNITNELSNFYQSFVNAHEKLKQNEKKKQKMKSILAISKILSYKKQIILQGPPGTGKTREAKLIADKILNADNEGLTPISLIESFFKKNSLTADNLGFQKKLQEFQTVFPKDQFLNMELDDYCIGKGNRNNFCWWIERGLEQYGKFTPGQSGNYVIYFSHSEQDYVVKKFNEPINEVFPKLKDTLNNLVNKEDTQSALNFFGESFILKILNSYYPDKYFPINGKKALENAVKIFNIDTKRKSAIELNKILQDKFLELKNKNNSTATALDFMVFLFKNFNLNEDGLIISDFDGKITKRKPTIIQFHPSYTYEDFVRGIVAETKDKNIDYKTKNKILAELAKEAYENQYLDYVLIIDEINRANLSSVLGELIYALEYRCFFDDSEEKQSESKVESPYSLIDENTGETSREIFLPENLYIIGTMNTADRSVGHIDYAIRRRFAFVEVLPKDLSSEVDDGEFYTDLFSAVKALFTKDEYQTKSDFISQEFEPKDVALGHSYFIDKTEEGGDKKTRWHYEIKPILLEYVRDGVLKESALEQIASIEKSIDLKI